ncbi:LCP family protein [Pseudonocardia parietis]|uniref:LCP family protein required for cell wall assembly n=1 Tax=Pseudonocardia parietis TaxID=570936 RepID=A0ABS4VQY3_9PSEU|nr:LCP family protein [Pseudonocardia parietis]MBP2366335.1 LCP family protein required for cell wall assembly [Pseudonocardia parietis]
MLVLLLVVAGGLAYLVSSIGSDVPRIPDAFRGLETTERPAASGGTTFLLVGTDSRAREPTTGSGANPDAVPGSQRSDAIMLGTLAPDGHSASVVSIPRDSWVEVPGRGMNKINAAYAFGGAPLLIGTVEQLTGVRVDHFGVVDFAGFTSLVDSVGGIDVTVARATGNDGVDFVQGENHLDGAQALAYVRQRYDLPGGDLDRAARQQNAMKALLEKVQEKATTDPGALYAFATSVGDAVSIDDSLSNTGLVQLAVGNRNLRGSDVTFVTAPVAGLGREGAQSVVYVDERHGEELWDAVRNGSVRQFADLNPALTLGDVPS